MTQEDKKLLLKDLCARLHYGVKVTWDEKNPLTLNPHIYAAIWERYWERYDFGWKPYLRPMSSMTEEELEELNCLCYHNIGVQDGMLCGYICANEMNDVIDFLNKYHFDYRGLIEKGLALEASKGMYNTE